MNFHIFILHFAPKLKQKNFQFKFWFNFLCFFAHRWKRKFTSSSWKFSVFAILFSSSYIWRQKKYGKRKARKQTKVNYYTLTHTHTLYLFPFTIFYYSLLIRIFFSIKVFSFLLFFINYFSFRFFLIYFPLFLMLWKNIFFFVLLSFCGLFCFCCFITKFCTWKFLSLSLAFSLGKFPRFSFILCFLLFNPSFYYTFMYY